MTIETRIAKNGSKRYYVRDENGKLSQISREKAYELQIEADNKIMANLFEQTAEKEMTDIEQANYIAHVDIETVKSPTVHIKYAISLEAAAKFIRLCGEAFGGRLVNAYIRDTKSNTVNAETTTETESTSTEKKLYKVFKANHDDEVIQETATKLDIIIDEKRINVSMNVNRKTLKSAYNVFTKALEQAVADGVISAKAAQFGYFADDINDIDFGGKDHVEAHDNIDNSFAYGIDDNTCCDLGFYFWFWTNTDNGEGDNKDVETENGNTEDNEVTTTESNTTRHELEIEKKIIMDEIDEIRDELIEIETEDGDEDELTPQSHIDYLKAQEADLVGKYYEVCAKLDEFKDDLPPENNTDAAEHETANAEDNTATDTTPEYKYYIKSRHPIFGAAPNGYIKAVSGEVHEPVRRPNGTYSPKCRIYFATVIYDKPLTDEQILNYDLAVSNETFELLNTTTAEGEKPISEVANAPEVARFQKGKTYRYYDANTGEPLWYITIDKRTNTSVTVSGEKFKVFIQNHDRFLNYNKPTESFIRGNYRIDATDACEESADEITPATLQKFIEAKKEVSYWRNSNGARIWQIAYIRYGFNGGFVGQTPWLNRTMKEADRYLKDEYDMTLLEYLAAEDKWNDTDKGAILKDKIERDCKPSVDELPALYPADDDNDGELIDPPEIEFNEHIFIGQDGTNFIIRAKNLNITVEDRKIKINGHIVAKYKTDAGVAAALKYVTDWRNNIANYKTFDINDWNTVFDDFDFAGGNEDKFVYIDDEPPVTSKTITPDEMLAIIDTLDTVNAAAPYGWQIEFDGKNFPIEFNGKLVTTLDSLALAKALPPERFFEQFAPDVSPKERYINDRHKELDMLLDFRKFVEDDPDRLNTLANLIEDVKREILNAELDTEHPPDIEYDEHGEVIPWF